MRPSRKLLQFLGVFMIAFLAIWMTRTFGGDEASIEWVAAVRSALLLASIFATIAVLYDGFELLRGFDVNVVRKILGGFSQGVGNAYQLVTENRMGWSSRITIIDGIPDSFGLEQATIEVNASSGETFTHEYKVVPRQRGDFSIFPAWVRATSRWGFWERIKRLGETSEVQVYPNFAALGGGLELGLDHQIQMFGVHMMQRRGEGIDFRQLKEFVYGDSPGKVDWKASSRMGKLIAREYQDERDQNIFFMLDCGHRMRALDQGFSYFDHAVNALLMTSYVALKQGDSVGLVSFAGERRWISPVKGENGMRSLLNQTYNLQSSVETSDYVELAHHFVEKQPKRSLVILITSVHSDDHLDVMNTVQLLKQKHIVMLVTIDEPFLKDVSDMSIENDADAKNYAGKLAYDYAREQLFRKLQAVGVVALRTGVTELSKTLTSEYLKLKRAGRI